LRRQGWGGKSVGAVWQAGKLVKPIVPECLGWACNTGFLQYTLYRIVGRRGAVFGLPKAAMCCWGRWGRPHTVAVDGVGMAG